MKDRPASLRVHVNRSVRSRCGSSPFFFELLPPSCSFFDLSCCTCCALLAQAQHYQPSSRWRFLDAFCFSYVTRPPLIMGPSWFIVNQGHGQTLASFVARQTISIVGARLPPLAVLTLIYIECSDILYAASHLLVLLLPPDQPSAPSRPLTE